MNLRIRDATIDDAASIADFNCRLALETEDKHLDRKVVRRGVELAFERSDMCRYLLAEADGRVVGQCMITYEWSDWRAGVLWWFQSVYVEKDFRRRGIFRRLYQHVEALARSDDTICGLRLYVENENHRAQQTYEALGMRRCDYLVFEVDWS